jgi:TatD DNase family protein
MQFIDSHAHLCDPAFDADRPQTVQRVLQAGVTKFIEIACQTEEWDSGLAFAQTYSAHCAVALGIHPEFARTYTEQEHIRLARLLKDPRAAAVGEIGLDYVYLHESDKDTQIRVLEQMLWLANQTQKPIVLHIRREGEDYEPYEKTFEMLKHIWKPATSLKKPGVLHCFSAGYETAKQALDHGLLLGINGCFTYKKNEYIREAVKKAGADKLVLETDCPYLSPQGKRGTRNDPSNIPLIGQWVADYLNMPLEKLAELTTQNALDLYELH